LVCSSTTEVASRISPISALASASGQSGRGDQAAGESGGAAEHEGGDRRVGAVPQQPGQGHPAFARAVAQWSQSDGEGEQVQQDDHGQDAVADEVGAGRLGVEHGLERLGRSRAHTADQDADGGDERPEEPFPAVAERMGVVRGPAAADDADQQEGADHDVGQVRGGLGLERRGTRHDCGRAECRGLRDGHDHAHRHTAATGERLSALVLRRAGRGDRLGLRAHRGSVQAQSRISGRS
jgi:hypothetical protein